MTDPTDEQLRRAARDVCGWPADPGDIEQARAWWSAIAPLVREQVLEEAAAMLSALADDPSNYHNEEAWRDAVEILRALKGKP